MRAREAIEADLEILTWPHVVLDAAVVYDRLLRDVEPLLAALDEATRRADQAEARAEQQRQRLELMAELQQTNVRLVRERNAAVQALADAVRQAKLEDRQLAYAETVHVFEPLTELRRVVSEGSSE